MSRLRQYVLGFLYRTAICLCLLLICYIFYRLWPNLFTQIRLKLFYSINYGEAVSYLKNALRCLMPQ